jgi:hypothetical protein
MESEQGLIFGTSSRIRTEIYLFLEHDPDPSSIYMWNQNRYFWEERLKTQGD